MNPFEWLRKTLQEQSLIDVDVDSDELIEKHRGILLRKKIIRDVFLEFYKTYRGLEEKYFEGPGLRVEIGAGSSLFKHFYPEILSTDIKKAKHLDRVIDAQDMDLEPNSVRVIYGTHCFHHFPHPEKFFSELERVLQEKGGCILIEPYYGPLASAFYQRVFETEHFNKDQKSWDSDDQSQGVMKGANQALSYIVFKRDRKIFEEKFPHLQIVHQRVFTNYLRYFLSGGINFKSLVPQFMAPAVRLAEALLYPAREFFGLHHLIVLKKISPKKDPLHER